MINFIKNLLAKKPLLKTNEIVPGCWIKAAPSMYQDEVYLDNMVCISVDKHWINARYCVTRAIDGKTMWVLHTFEKDSCEFVKHPDAESKKILKLRGPYGLGR